MEVRHLFEVLKVRLSEHVISIRANSEDAVATLPFLDELQKLSLARLEKARKPRTFGR